MNAWIVFWKAVLIFSVGIFAVMAVWVTVAGLRDIRQLFATIEKTHEDESH